VTWNDITGLSNSVAVKAQIYDPNLNKVGGQITVIPVFIQTAGFTGADVFATPDGGFAYADSINKLETVQAFHADGSKNGAAIQTGGQIPAILRPIIDGDLVPEFRSVGVVNLTNI
jgi:hypothetical protein